MKRSPLAILSVSMPIITAFAVTLGIASTVFAPPPGGLEGTVYYFTSGTLLRWSMNPDGSNKTLLPSGVTGEPSHDLHNNQRWWLQERETREIDPPVFSGTGLDDLNPFGSGGDPVRADTWWITYTIEIDGTGSPDTFQWWAESSFFAGQSPTITGVPVSVAPGYNELPIADHDAALILRFGAETGHTLGDRWVVTVDRSQPPTLYTVREDGLFESLVFDPLTNQVGMEPLGDLRWATDAATGTRDGVVSWIGQRWDLATGVVVEDGIYSAKVGFDGDGNVLPPAVQPPAPPVPGDPGGIREQDWSPDGTQLVFFAIGGTWVEALYVADTTTGLHTILTTNVFQPHAVWSPGGTSIAFRSDDPRGISTIDSDGTNEDLVLWGNGVTRVLKPQWSPTGSHLVYSRDSVFIDGDRDVYRATAAGKQKSNLTPDIVPWSIPFAWRGDNGGGTPTPPAAPSNLAAAAVSSSQIDLSWTDNSANEDGFEIERSLDSSNWSPIATVGVNVNIYNDSGLAAETQYFYRVRAGNAQGDSAYSNVASATTLADGGGVLAFVDCISYATSGGPNGDKHLQVTVRIVDEFNNPSIGVTVDVTISGPDGTTDSATTDATGSVTFSIHNAADGFYSTAVTDIGPGVVFDGSEPINDFLKGTDPSGTSFPPGCGN